MKSFRRRDGTDQDSGPSRNGERDFHGDKRSMRRTPPRRIQTQVCRVSTADQNQATVAA
jgi:hypothetical protein